MNVLVKNHKQSDSLFFILTYLISIAFYHYFYAGYLIDNNHLVGGDYSYFAPYLLNGFYWFQVNGPFEVPWFTPSFCGGLPFFPNPQVMFYSVPQFLTFLVDPVFSIYLTFIIFASLGYFGFYFLLNHIFHATREVSAFGAILFLFNGFYLHRFFMGHLTYHSYMLIPLITYFLLRRSANRQHNCKPVFLMDTVISGILIAYIFHSGAANFIVPMLLSVIGIWIIYGLVCSVEIRFWFQLVVAGSVAVCLSASKLVSSIAYIDNFPRDFYLLPGIEGFWKTILFVLQTLFFPGSNEIGNQIVNSSFPMENRGFEFGITFVPLIILLLVIIATIYNWSKTRKRITINWKWDKTLLLIMLTGLLLLPVFLNIYTPSWNSFLKSLPYIKNSSLLIRWIAIDIPLIILITVLIVDKLVDKKLIKNIAILGSIGVIAINAGYKHDYDKRTFYNSETITASYYRAKEYGIPPGIKYIGVNVNNNKISITLNRNDSLTQGVSQLFCYEPIFGYGLEKFPVNTLHPGPVMDQNDGYLNIKKPSCYVYGSLNQCMPGDHFPVNEMDQAEVFVNYRPVFFNMPIKQKIANWINKITLACIVIMIPVYAGRRILHSIKKI